MMGYRFANNCRFFLSYSWYTYLALFSWLSPQTYLVLKILAPITQVLFFTLLGRATGGDPSYYVIGNATQLAATSGIFGIIQVFVTERRMGTLPHLMMTPTNSAVTLYARGLFLIFDGLTSVFAGLIVGVVFFGLTFPHVSVAYVLIALLVTSFSVSALGLVLGVMGLIGTDLNLLLNIALAVLLVICGVEFPVTDLPVPIQAISQLLPLTHGLIAVRAAFAGRVVDVFTPLVWEFIVGLGYLILGYVLFSYVERLSRAHATLELQ